MAALNDSDWTADAVARITALLASREPRAGRTTVVAVDGRSGSGKTTLSAALCAAAADGSQDAPVLHLDHVYPGWDGLAAALPRVREQVLDPLAHGRPARYQRYDWLHERYGRWRDLPAAPVLVLDGVGSGSRLLAERVSLLVWLEADTAVRRARGLARDGETYAPHWQRWADQEDRHFAADRTRERADLVLRTDQGRR